MPVRGMIKTVNYILKMAKIIKKRACRLCGIKENVDKLIEHNVDGKQIRICSSCREELR